MFLLILDANSEWPEIVNMGKNTKVDKLIIKFKVILSRFGLPEFVVCDNGPQYRSKEFRSFLKHNGIRQSFSPPFHSATNGVAENHVYTFKTKVYKIVRNGRSLDDAINLFLFDYRSTVHCTTDRSAAFLMLGRELRTRFDLLKPDVRKIVEKRQYAQKSNAKGDRKCNLSKGDRVSANDNRINKCKRAEAIFVNQNSPLTFDVKFKDGYVCKKHAKQVISTKLDEVPSRRRECE